MGLIQRNGRFYYYRSKRVNGRVVNKYVASGAAARRLARLDERWRKLGRRLKALDEDLDDEQREIDGTLEALTREALDLARADLERAGYHQHHRGEWRKRRVDRASLEAPK